MGFGSNFSFLGIGIPELVFIIMLALVVLGPDRLPGVAKDLVRAFFKVRNLSKDLTGQLEQELGVAEIKELKGIRTGKLIEDWANDELDLDFDEDEEDRKAAKSQATKSQAAQKKPVKKPAGKVELPAAAEAKAEEVPDPAAASAKKGVRKVESGEIFESANSIGARPDDGEPTLQPPELKNGTVAALTKSAGAEIGFTANGSGPAARQPRIAAIGATGRETLQRRRELRTQRLGPGPRMAVKIVGPSLRRTLQRRQSPAARVRTR